MGKKKQYLNFRLKRAAELRLFQRILKGSFICRNPEIITGAADTLENMNKTKDKTNWGYEIQNLFFEFSAIPKNTKPNHSNSLGLMLNLKVRGTIENCEKIKDPFDELIFDVVILGRDSQNLELVCAYHLDRHIGNNNGIEEAIHPIYHFQFGGHKMDFNAYNFGQLILLESPRLAHYPMELILGIDFILSNFFYETWLEFRQDGEYTNLIRQYRDLFLKPYVKALNKVWENDKNFIEWDHFNIWPHL